MRAARRVMARAAHSMFCCEESRSDFSTRWIGVEVPAMQASAANPAGLTPSGRATSKTAKAYSTRAAFRASPTAVSDLACALPALWSAAINAMPAAASARENVP